jgi:hypothetical protein
MIPNEAVVEGRPDVVGSVRFGSTPVTLMREKGAKRASVALVLCLEKRRTIGSSFHFGWKRGSSNLPVSMVQ